MAKKQDFISKTMKGSKHDSVCPVCEAPISYLRHVKTEKSDKTGAWRFNQNHVPVCKCNEKELYN